jgi:hypothetical protein
MVLRRHFAWRLFADRRNDFFLASAEIVVNKFQRQQQQQQTRSYATSNARQSFNNVNEDKRRSSVGSLQPQKSAKRSANHSSNVRFQSSVKSGKRMTEIWMRRVRCTRKAKRRATRKVALPAPDVRNSCGVIAIDFSDDSAHFCDIARHWPVGCPRHQLDASSGGGGRGSPQLRMASLASRYRRMEAWIDWQSGQERECRGEIQSNW